MIATARTTRLILWFEELGLGDNALSSSGVRVPNGLAVTAGLPAVPFRQQP